LRAKVTVLAEGPRGSLTKELVSKLKLDGLNPQVYGLGIKELWDVQPEESPRATSLTRSAGRSARISTAAAGFTACRIIASRWAWSSRWNITTRFSIRTKRSRNIKTHPFVKNILEGGKLIRYGAKTVPYGGWYSMPRSYVDGG